MEQYMWQNFKNIKNKLSASRPYHKRPWNKNIAARMRACRANNFNLFCLTDCLVPGIVGAGGT